MEIQLTITTGDQRLETITLKPIPDLDNATFFSAAHRDVRYTAVIVDHHDGTGENVPYAGELQ